MHNIGVVHLDNKYKKCNYCGEDVEASAKRCPLCGSILDVEIDNLDNNTQKDENINEGGTELNKKEEKVPDAKPYESPENEGSELKSGNPEMPRGNIDNRDYMRRQQFAYNQYKNNFSPSHTHRESSLSNGLKVFITVLCTIIPGLGQLAGIIISIIYMNTQEIDPDFADKRSFGLALLIACIIIFVLTCIGCFAIAFAASYQYGF